MKHIITVGTAVAALFALAACSAQDPAQPAAASPAPAVQRELTTKLLVSDGGTKALTVENAPSGPRVEATVAGQVSRDGAGCVILLGNDGTDWTLIFPAGTSLDGEAAVLPDGSVLTHGDHVSVDGNRVPANEGASMCLNYARLLSVERAAAG
ncbi:hypothetical protein [Pseudarthrobacter sp. lyk4-40-TYG-27]|uniref:hypothetical protein n=1 Tax=Pseudarthrobacter sp. lyk4-40-TYG-27 TaxID=3040305 RepID=UPI0025540B77|nr:hypothetical protein [Pseudarthrobacter sp. lyk4-40-TYG-27]